MRVAKEPSVAVRQVELATRVLLIRSSEERLCSGKRMRIVYARSLRITGVAEGSPSNMAAASMAISSGVNPARAATAGITWYVTAGPVGGVSVTFRTAPAGRVFPLL